MSELLASIYTCRSIGLVANGIFAGVGLCMNFVNVPAIKATQDPLPVFYKTYNNGSKLAIACIFASTVSNGISYYTTKERQFAYATLLSFISFPFTLLFIKPVNNQLFDMEKKPLDKQKVHKLVVKWNKLQYVRTTAGVAAFIINVLYHK